MKLQQKPMADLQVRPMKRLEEMTDSIGIKGVPEKDVGAARIMLGG